MNHYCISSHPNPNPHIHVHGDNRQPPPLLQVQLAIAEHEPAEFRRHSEAYAARMLAKHQHCQLVDVPAVDHFDCIENLHQPEYQLTKMLLEMAHNAAAAHRHTLVASLP